jgi:hypothetical protein
MLKLENQKPKNKQLISADYELIEVEKIRRSEIDKHEKIRS